jgi:hypothetical protein
VLLFLTAGVHYSYARPELNLTRGDALNSSARIEPTENTVDFEGHLHIPHVHNWRAYGLAGAGILRITPTVEVQSHNPFPDGTGSVDQAVLHGRRRRRTPPGPLSSA